MESGTGRGDEPSCSGRGVAELVGVEVGGGEVKEVGGGGSRCTLRRKGFVDIGFG
jgi:hypothetical protein